MKTLLMWSGGLDSTTALYKLLRETDDEVEAHFIEYRNIQGRSLAELEAVTECHNRLRAVRPFTFTQSIQDYSQVRFTPPDLLVIRFTAAMLCRCRDFDFVATGRCADDDSVSYRRRLARGTELFNLVIGPTTPPAWKFPVERLTKQQQIDILKREMPELLPLVHYCRKPLDTGRWTNCGKCKTCRQTRRANPDVFSLRLPT